MARTTATTTRAATATSTVTTNARKLLQQLYLTHALACSCGSRCCYIYWQEVVGLDGHGQGMRAVLLMTITQQLKKTYHSHPTSESVPQWTTAVVLALTWTSLRTASHWCLGHTSRHISPFPSLETTFGQKQKTFHTSYFSFQCATVPNSKYSVVWN